MVQAPAVPGMRKALPRGERGLWFQALRRPRRLRHPFRAYRPRRVFFCFAVAGWQVFVSVSAAQIATAGMSQSETKRAPAGLSQNETQGDLLQIDLARCSALSKLKTAPIEGLLCSGIAS